MGVNVPVPAAPLASPVGNDQDAFFKTVSDDLADKGFVISNLDKLVNWARTGSMWPT